MASHAVQNLVTKPQNFAHSLLATQLFWQKTLILPKQSAFVYTSRYTGPYLNVVHREMHSVSTVKVYLYRLYNKVKIYGRVHVFR